MIRIFVIALIVILLSACWGLSLKSSAPDKYKDKENIEDLYGATNSEILSLFGNPTWKVKGKQSTYYIYEWRKKDRFWGWVFYVPLPLVATTDVNWYCLLLEFDKDNHLIDHESAGYSYERDSTGGKDTGYKLLDCLSILRDRSVATQPGRIIEKSEMSSDEGGPSYTYLIVTSEEEKVRALSKYSGYEVGDCVSVLIDKLGMGIRITASAVCPDRSP